MGCFEGEGIKLEVVGVTFLLDERLGVEHHEVASFEVVINKVEGVVGIALLHQHHTPLLQQVGLGRHEEFAVADVETAQHEESVVQEDFSVFLPVVGVVEEF